MNESELQIIGCGIIIMFAETIAQNRGEERMIPEVYEAVLDKLISDYNEIALQRNELVKEILVFSSSGWSRQLGIMSCFANDLREDEIPF